MKDAIDLLPQHSRADAQQQLCQPVAAQPLTHDQALLLRLRGCVLVRALPLA